ncbi:MAG: hypothetical protein QM736_03440 [Vicinamibacterales bacterium]
MTSPDPIVDVVRAIVERVAGPACTPARADAATPLAQGYWLDSMELLEIVLACEEHFGIAFEEASDSDAAEPCHARLARRDSARAHGGRRQSAMTEAADRADPTLLPLDESFRGPAQVQQLLPVLRRVPSIAPHVLATLSVADGLVRRRRFRRACAWAAAAGYSGWRVPRIALGLLATHGRFIALESMIGIRSMRDLREQTTIVGREHLEALTRGGLVIGMHVGPPRSWLALRAHGIDVSVATRREPVPGSVMAHYADRGIAVHMPFGDATDRVQGLYAMHRLLRKGGLLVLAGGRSDWSGTVHARGCRDTNRSRRMVRASPAAAAADAAHPRPSSSWPVGGHGVSAAAGARRGRGRGHDRLPEGADRNRSRLREPLSDAVPVSCVSGLA